MARPNPWTFQSHSMAEPQMHCHRNKTHAAQVDLHKATKDLEQELAAQQDLRWKAMNDPSGPPQASVGKAGDVSLFIR